MAKMPSAPLSPDNDYRFPPAPAEALLDRATWDAVMGSQEPGNEGLGPRLRALEAKRVELQAIIDDLRLFGLQRLDSAIVPLIEDTQQRLSDLQQTVATTLAQNNAIIAAFIETSGDALENLDAQISAAILALNQQIDTAVADLNASVSAVEARFDMILAGGISAANVNETAVRFFLTPAQRAELVQLRTDLTTLNTNLTATITNATKIMATAAIFSAVAGRSYRITSAGAVTITLPAAPVSGDMIRLLDGGAVTATVAHTVARNGKTIMAKAENLMLNVPGFDIQLWWDGSTWRLF